MKKIKSVKRNGVNYDQIGIDYWSTRVRQGTLSEWVSEDVIRNCPLFEVEYEPERWRAVEGQKYFYLSGFSFLIDWEYERGRDSDLTRYTIGNYFKTKQQAQRCINEFLNILQKIHEKEEIHEEEGNYEYN